MDILMFEYDHTDEQWLDFKSIKKPNSLTPDMKKKSIFRRQFITLVEVETWNGLPSVGNKKKISCFFS